MMSPPLPQKKTTTKNQSKTKRKTQTAVIPAVMKKTPNQTQTVHRMKKNQITKNPNKRIIPQTVIITQTSEKPLAPKKSRGRKRRPSRNKARNANEATTNLRAVAVTRPIIVAATKNINQILHKPAKKERPMTKMCEDPPVI